MKDPYLRMRRRPAGDLIEVVFLAGVEEEGRPGYSTIAGYIYLQVLWGSSDDSLVEDDGCHLAASA